MYNCEISDEEVEQLMECRKMLKAIDNNNLKKFKEIFGSKYFTKENLVPPDNRRSLLIYACERCNTNVVKHILKSNKCSKKLLMHTINAGNVLHHVCENGNLKILKLIMSSRLCDKKLIDQRNLNDKTPLMVLINNNYIECAKYLINSKKCVINCIDILFNVYLTNPRIFEHIINSKVIVTELIEALIKKIFLCKYGVNVESFVILLNSKYVTEDLLIVKQLHIRLFGENGNNELAMKFVESSKFTYNVLSTQNKYSVGCLHFAFAYRSIDIVLKILDKPFVDNSMMSQLDETGDNVLEYLYLIDAPKRAISEIKQILEHPKIKPCVLELLLPNMYYICREYPDMFLYLINFEGVTKETLINSHIDGWTCLAICAAFCSSQIMDLLNINMFDKDYITIQTEPDEESNFVTFGNMNEVVQKGGQTFLHILAYKNPELFLQIMTHEKVQYILQIKDNSGNTCYNFLIASNNNGYGKCKICFEHDDFVALNCGHICCTSCAQSLTMCHLCREHIIEFIKVYL